MGPTENPELPKRVQTALAVVVVLILFCGPWLVQTLTGGA